LVNEIKQKNQTINLITGFDSYTTEGATPPFPRPNIEQIDSISL
jgi:hypothetical protein